MKIKKFFVWPLLALCLIATPVLLAGCDFFQQTDNTPVAVESVTVNGSAAATVNIPQTYTAVITPDNATVKTVTWAVTGAGASITQEGVLTATQAGAVIVTATSNNGKVGTKEVTVNPETPNTAGADNAAITSAKAAIQAENLNATVYNQSQGNTQADVRAALIPLIEALDLETEYGVEIEIKDLPLSFHAAIAAGTSGNPNGTNGQALFQIEISKGQGSTQTMAVTITIIATPL